MSAEPVGQEDVGDAHKAADASRIFDPQRLRIARQESRLSGRELATRIGVSAAAVSQWEKGTSRPRAHLVEQLASELSYPIDYFATSGRNVPNLDSGCSFFRSVRGSRQVDRDAAAADAVLIAELALVIERWVKLPELDIPSLPPSSDSPEEQEIDDIALNVREHWGLGREPISDVLREMELHGALAARLPLADEVDAFSWPAYQRPVVILGVEKQNRIRSRFDAAHELGHLVMHREHPRPADPDLERQAHRFASAFLIPPPRLAEAWPKEKIDWRVLMEIKSTWQISLQALLYRARRDALISETAYESATRYIRRAGWSVTEPGDEGLPERPRVLERAASILAERGIGLDALAREARLPLRLVEKYVEIRIPRRIAVDI